MDTLTKTFLIGLCLDRRKWAIEGRQETKSTLQVDLFSAEIGKCDKALEELIKL